MIVDAVHSEPHSPKYQNIVVLKLRLPDALKVDAVNALGVDRLSQCLQLNILSMATYRDRKIDPHTGKWDKKFAKLPPAPPIVSEAVEVDKSAAVPSSHELV